MSRASLKQAERDDALQGLKKLLKPGMTVYTILRNVSRSGMMRHITPIVFIKNEPWYLTHSAGLVLGWPVVRGGYDAVKVSGAGMDIGFHLVYSLGQVVFGDGYQLNHRWL